MIAPQCGTRAMSLGAMCLYNAASDPSRRAATSVKTRRVIVRRPPLRLASVALCNMALYLYPYFSLYDQTRALR